MAKPSCVIIGDIHFTPATLELATAALCQARDKAKELGVPLVLNGDTLDSKAIIRGECANRLIDILQEIDPTQVYVNTGNHDLLSVKGKESSLNFLRPYANVVSSPVYVDKIKSWIIPYFDSGEDLTTVLAYISPGNRLLVHQGVMGANMGHYVKDTSSLPTQAYADFRVVASHYHCAQDIKTGRPRKGAVGLFSYVGNPYSLSWSEANDPPKGFAVLYDDGILERVPTNLRRHVVMECAIEEALHPCLWRYSSKPYYSQDDLLWLKVQGTRSELAKCSKDIIARSLGRTDFKLDLIPTDAPALEAKTETMTGAEILDALIDNEPESADEKQALKSLWREAVS